MRADRASCSCIRRGDLYGFLQLAPRTLTFSDVFINELQLSLFKGWALLIWNVALPGACELSKALDFLEVVCVDER